MVTAKSDIDCVAVVPKHISKDAFFAQFPAKLEEYSAKHDGCVKDVSVILDAHTPIIAMVFRGIDMDLSC